MSDNGIDEDRLCIDEGSEHSMDVDEAPITVPRSRAECENSDKPGPSTSTSEECPGPSTREIVPKACKSTTSSAPLVERLNLEKEANQLRTAFLAETIRRGRKRKLDLRKRYHEGLNRSVVCGICDDFLVDPVTVKNCGHSFCSSCMTEQLTSYKFYCYECGLKIDMDDKNSVIPDNTLRDLCFEVCPSVFYEYVTRRRKFIAADLKESVRFVQRARHLINDDDMICVLLSFVACPKLSHERKETENSMEETQGTREDVTRMDTTVEESSEQDQKNPEDKQNSEDGITAKKLITSDVEKEKRSEEKKSSSPMFYRYFRCRADTKVGTLRKLIEAKLFVAETTHIHFFLPKRLNTVLDEETTLQDMIVAHGWKPYAPYHLLFTLQKEQSPEPPQLEVEAMPELLPEAPSEMPPALESVSPELLETPPPLMVTPIRENHQESCPPFESSASQHPIPLMRQNQNNSCGKKKKLSSSPTKKKSDCKIPTLEGSAPISGPAPSSGSNSNSPPPMLAPSAPVSVADPYRSPSEASPASNSNQMPSIFPQTPTTTQLPVKQQQQQMPTKQQQQQMANALAGFQGLAGQPGPFSVAVMTPNGPMIQTMTAMGTPTGFPTNPFMPMMSQGCTSFLQSMQQRFQWPQQQMQQQQQAQQQQHNKPPKEKKPRSNASPRVSQQPRPQNFSPSAPPPVNGPPAKQKTPPNSTHSSNKKYEIVVTAIPEGANALAQPQKPSCSAEQKPASIVSTNKGDPMGMLKNSVSTQFQPLPHGLQFPGTIGAQSANANGAVPTPFMISRPAMIPGQVGQNKQTSQVPSGQPTQSQHLPPTKPLRSVDHPGPKPSSVDKAILESLKAMKKREQSSKTSPPTGFNFANQASQAFFRQSAMPASTNVPVKFPQKSQQSKATNSVGTNGVGTMPKITEVMRVQTPPTSQKKSSQTPDLSTADVPLNMSISKMVPPTLKAESMGSVSTAPRPIVSPVGNSQSGRDAPLPVLVKELPSARASPSSPNLVKKEEGRKEERPPQILIGKQQVDLSYLQRNCSADVLARLTGQTLGKALMQSLKKSPAEETAPHLRRMSSSSGGSDTTTLGVSQTMRVQPLVVPASGQHT